MLSAIRVVSYAYLRLLIFLPVILIPACAYIETIKKKGIYLKMQKSNGILLSHKMNEIIPLVAAWMDLEIVTLSEVRQRKTNIT